jgi:LPXTG-motif cell wall-anchored protein
MTAASLILSVLMLAGFALAVGGGYMLVKRKGRRQGLLMLIAALVMWGNVAILTL